MPKHIPFVVLFAILPAIAFAQAVVTQINTDQYFTQVYRGNTGGETYVVYALCQIPRQKAEEDIRNFSRDVSERYGNLLAAPDSLMTALNSYNHVLMNLEQNPLHRAVAYYEGRNGRVNLYDFLVTEMNAIANSVTFMPVSSSVKQNDEALDMTLRINSSYAKDIGPLDLTASVAGIDGTRGSYLISPQNTVSLHINTGPLPRGKYTAQFEMPLKEIYPVLKTNPQGSFPFAMTSVSAGLVFQGSELNAQQKNAIIESVQQGIQRYNAPVRLLTNTSSGSVPYVIVVNYNFSRQPPKPPVPVDMYYCAISLALTRNSTVIHQAAAVSFTEIESGRVFSMAVGAVRENRSFFQGIASSLDK